MSCIRHPPPTHLTNGTSRERSRGRVHGLDFSEDGEWPGLHTPSRPGHRPSASPQSWHSSAARLDAGIRAAPVVAMRVGSQLDWW